MATIISMLKLGFATQPILPREHWGEEHRKTGNSVTTVPRSIQILISVFVVIGALFASRWQASLGHSTSQHVVLIVGAIMLVGMWIFPEAKGGRKKGD